MNQYSYYRSPRRRRERERTEKVFEEVIVENFPNVGKEIATQVKEAQSPIQNTPKEKHAETYSNQTNKK